MRKATLARHFVTLWERPTGRKRESAGDCFAPVWMNCPPYTTKGVSPYPSDTFRKGCRKSLFWRWTVRGSLHLPTLQGRMFLLYRWYSLLCTGGQVFTAGYHLIPNALYAAGLHKHAGSLPFSQGKGKRMCFTLIFLPIVWYRLIYVRCIASHFDSRVLG